MGLTLGWSRVSILRGCEMEFDAGPALEDPATGPCGGWDRSSLGLLWATSAAAMAAAALAAFMAAAAELLANEVAWKFCKAAGWIWATAPTSLK